MRGSLRSARWASFAREVSSPSSRSRFALAGHSLLAAAHFSRRAPLGVLQSRLSVCVSGICFRAQEISSGINTVGQKARLATISRAEGRLDTLFVKPAIFGRPCVRFNKESILERFAASRNRLVQKRRRARVAHSGRIRYGLGRFPNPTHTTLPIARPYLRNTRGLTTLTLSFHKHRPPGDVRLPRTAHGVRG